MSSSGIGPEQDPFEQRYRIEEIERIRWEERKRNGEIPPDKLPPTGNAGFAALAQLLLDKVLSFFKYSIKQGLEGASLEPFRENLLLFKAALETMMVEDRSQDAPFLKQVSKLWQEMLGFGIGLKSKSSWALRFKTLIKNIESYPENAEHTFGYYLDEYAGQKWLPFPYMELIQKLHREHELDPPSSLLSRWSGMIEEILNTE